MFGLDDIVETVVGGPVVAALIAGGAVAAIAAPHAKPLAKRAMKGYFAGTQRVREWAAEATEQVQDLYAEAKYEYESELANSQDIGEAEEPRPRRRAAAKADEQPA